VERKELMIDRHVGRGLIILAIVLVAFIMSGCTTAVKTIEVLNRPEPKTPIGIDLPEPLSLQPVEWIIITPENAEEVWAKLSENPKGEVVLFALDQDGYELVAKNFAQIRTALAEHRNVIIAYKDYYEPVTEEDLPAK
tara:strand:+ start:868 stop:1281 length:414 start_codon:yes stop_codon:yes gene_type:complete